MYVEDRQIGSWWEESRTRCCPVENTRVRKPLAFFTHPGGGVGVGIRQTSRSVDFDMPSAQEMVYDTYHIFDPYDDGQTCHHPALVTKALSV